MYKDKDRMNMLRAYAARLAKGGLGKIPVNKQARALAIKKALGRKK